MKFSKGFVFGIAAILLSISLAACGGGPADTADQSGTGPQDANQQTADQKASSQATAPEKVIVEQEIAEPDTAVEASNLVGSWVDVTSPDRFVNITQDGTDYQYEDNEGKLPAVFKDGILKVQVSDTETADVYIDTETGHLFTVYQDNIAEYTKK
jgi:predicted small secreted protein/predicted small lipoprotein YifL